MQGTPSTAVLTCSTAPLLQSRASPERNANLRRGFMTYTNGVEIKVSTIHRPAQGDLE